jgi:hypothetical protein
MQKNAPTEVDASFHLVFVYRLLVGALDGQETIAWVFVDAVASWKVSTLWALVFTKVVDALFFATAKRYVL